MSEAFVGEIRMFAGNYAPEGWTFCNGTLLQINNFEALYSLLGTLYGGNGVTTFGLPDYRGRLPVGMGNGPGLTPRVLTSTVGQATVTMTPENTPSHTHAFMVSTLDATSANPSLPADPNKMTFGKFDTAGIITGLYSAGTGTSATQVLHSGFLDSAQTNNAYATAHDNLMGSLTVSYIICLVGLYPTRNQ
ncbi:phage tail protein [Pseudomonas saponiphila]|uniref:Microcystin-dependent protein n=1 Tax=Pseudomonas saponiphila TaxID=556534 RepID=A0A1H4MWF9_9PSED|nr:tail fiber protein [Pseudomonas saponiphila]SEB86692.1 Microcystin-dependent protein [Pseudomonas saponiphila]